ncbi:MAG: methionine synthase [Deltaproteobacteria bacterium]|nr:methionine synthase [Deltaproteobacteria bacterium]
MNIRDEKLLIYDGACGTNIDTMNLPADAWNDGCAGYNDSLNISCPDAVFRLHSMFLAAGANVIETNTFGATPIVAAEYGLENDVDKINRLAVEHARRAINDKPGLYVAGSIGPGTKLPSLGHITPNEITLAYTTQIRALVEEGVDILTIETCQDLLQLKTVLIAAFNILEETGRDIPVQVSVTVESTGTMLLGTRIDAVVAAIEPFPIFSLGLNCATGPEEMTSHVAHLGRHWHGRISVVPNAGIPEVVDGKAVFPLDPDDFAAQLKNFVQHHGVSIVGGCCGTTPEHIRCLREALADTAPGRQDPVEYRPSLASLYNATEMAQEIPPLIIGERMNANGSKKFRGRLLEDDFEACVKIGQQQEAKGAHLLDLSTAYAGRDEIADMGEMIRRISTAIRAPLVIDSTTPKVVEEALSLYPGRAVINSVNLEDGGTNLDRICGVVKKHGAAVIALAIGPDGMAMTADDKMAVAKKIYDRAVNEHGLRTSDIFFDMLTFTIGSGDVTLNDAAEQTLDAIRRLKKEIPDVFTILGVSNISFGLPRAARKMLNSIFLGEAIDAGLDAAIIDAGKILPVARIPKEEREICLDLIYNRAGDGDSPLERFIEHFKTRKTGADDDKGKSTNAPIEKQLEDKLIAGDSSDLPDLISIALERYEPLDVINQILVPSMRRIGELFGRGEMLLPFVLKSAEVMKKSVDALSPFMTRTDGVTKKKILLATVKGDVHDIGKNLVDIILTNNGFDVINIGTNIPIETIVKEAIENRVDAIGLSGLLVKSAMLMKEIMPLFAKAGLDVPVLLGGAALTPRFVVDSCVPGHSAPVRYCQDAFEGLTAMQALEQGELQPTRLPDKKSAKIAEPDESRALISRENPVPEPPFIGARYIEKIDPAILFERINKQALFRGRWGYKRADMSAEDYNALLSEKVAPIFDELKRRVVAEKLAVPKVAYGYFKCFSKGDTLLVKSGDVTHRFDFPRQSFGTRLCIADYFKPENEGGDTVGFFVATLGESIMREARALYDADQYHDYLMLHGFAVELTDALAEYWHETIRDELGIEQGGPKGTPVCSCQGTRYGFGYPSCPDLGANKTVFELINPSKIGVTLTETMEMVPEVSTSAIVVHHPDATYFAV